MVFLPGSLKQNAFNVPEKATEGAQNNNKGQVVYNEARLKLNVTKLHIARIGEYCNTAVYGAMQ